MTQKNRPLTSVEPKGLARAARRRFDAVRFVELELSALDARA